MATDRDGNKASKSEVITRETEAYLAFFKDSIDKLEANYNKSELYTKTIDDMIEKLSKAPATSPKAVTTLSELMESVVSLQSQKQSNLKDIFTIKKAILDYTFKEKGEDTSDIETMMKTIKGIIKSEPKNIQTNNQDVEDLNEQIAKTLDVAGNQTKA